MFTGIIIGIGKLVKKEKNFLEFSAKKKILKELKIGSSVSVNGICLTVAGKTSRSFNARIMSETFRKTNLGHLRGGAEVNLELAIKANSRFEGHIVQGHIDGTAKIKNIEKEKYGLLFTFSAPKKLMKYIVEKGSVAVNGISLTVACAKGNNFSVGIIPHTLEKTMLKNSRIGDQVNIETDILAKYLEKNRRFQII